MSLQQFTCFILDFLSFYLLFEMVLHELIISRMLKSNLQLIGELYKLREEGSSLDVFLVGIDGKTHVHLPVLTLCTNRVVKSKFFLNPHFFWLKWHVGIDLLTQRFTSELRRPQKG